jgi:hypothetical protein
LHGNKLGLYCVRCFGAKNLASVKIMSAIALYFCIFGAIFFPSHADDHLSLDDLIYGATETAYETVVLYEDADLENILVRHKKRGNPSLNLRADDEPLFLKLDPDMVSRLLHREREAQSSSQYMRWVQDHVGERDRVMGYGTDGTQRFKLVYDEEFIEDPRSEISFLTSMVSGFILNAGRFPLKFKTLVERHKKSRGQSPLFRYVDPSGAKFNLGQVEVQAYLMIAYVGGKLRTVAVSGKNIDLLLGHWVREALGTVFYRYFGYDTEPNLPTTSERWERYRGVLGKYSQTLEKLQSQPEFSSGPLKSLKTFLGNENADHYTLMIFGTEKLREAHGSLVDLVSKTLSDPKRKQGDRKGLKHLAATLKSYKELIDSETKIHSQRLKTHLDQNGLVTLE